jgi:uncharacterized protein YkwD/uncharacterized membrane protein required for colicin V production
VADIEAFFLEHWLDAAIALVILFFAIQGFARGLALWAIDLAGLVVGVLVAVRYFGPAGASVAQVLPLPAGTEPVIGFIALFVGVQVVAQVVAVFVNRLIGPPRSWWGMLNAIAGIPVGVAFGTALIAIMLTLSLRLPLPPEYKDTISQSLVAGRLVLEGSAIPPALLDAIEPAELAPLLQTRRVGTDESVPLGALGPGTPAPVQEERMLALVNEERAAHGLAPLRFDSRLTALARQHSTDMVTNRFFSHVSPGAGDPARRAQVAGYDYRVFGENIALAPTLNLAHRGLMDSPGHRANILGPAYGRIGIGILDLGLDGLIVTQEFSD